jgi:hypothetical protein
MRRFAVASVAFLLAGCATQTLAGAERGMRVACAALAEVVSQGSDVTAAELVARACQPERTRRMMEIIAKRAPPHELAPLDESWLPSPPAAATDAGDGGPP